MPLSPAEGAKARTRAMDGWEHTLTRVDKHTPHFFSHTVHMHYSWALEQGFLPTQKMRENKDEYIYIITQTHTLMNKHSHMK